jgi:hypothetical protein
VHIAHRASTPHNTVPCQPCQTKLWTVLVPGTHRHVSGTPCPVNLHVSTLHVHIVYIHGIVVTQHRRAARRWKWITNIRTKAAVAGRGYVERPRPTAILAANGETLGSSAQSASQASPPPLRKAPDGAKTSPLQPTRLPAALENCEFPKCPSAGVLNRPRPTKTRNSALPPFPRRAAPTPPSAQSPRCAGLSPLSSLLSLLLFSLLLFSRSPPPPLPPTPSPPPSLRDCSSVNQPTPRSSLRAAAVPCLLPPPPDPPGLRPSESPDSTPSILAPRARSLEFHPSLIPPASCSLPCH